MRADFYNSNVFINCPFSSDYDPIFWAVLFTVFYAGFRPRCAREVSDAAQVRYAKILQIIRESKFGIHDISVMDLDPVTKLPRFNMPFEVGLFFAAKDFGSNKQRDKVALVMDSGDFLYRAALSDISGQDIASHGGDPEKAIHVVRNWLDNCRGGPEGLHGGAHIVEDYNKFLLDLPVRLKKVHLDVASLTYGDLCRAIEGYLLRKKHRRLVGASKKRSKRTKHSPK
jgi:hypothetical protein